jgi:tetratricopeptide (TPR) repeat protein
MRFSRVCIPGIILALWLAAASASAGETNEFQLPREKDRWIRAETPNFTVFSNAKEDVTAQTGEDLEQLRAVLVRLFGGVRFESPVPTLIYVFDDADSYIPYGPFYEGKPRLSGGYFSRRQLANYVTIVGGKYRYRANPGIFHEYLHYVLKTNYAELPLWLEEGLAEYYSVFRIEDGKAYIGTRIDLHMMRVRREPLIPLEQFFAIEHSSPEYHDKKQLGMYYAQSWIITHMLVSERPEGRVQASVYVELLREGHDRDEAFEQAFQTTYEDFDKELRKYIRQHKHTYTVVPLRTNVRDHTTVSEMTRAETLFRLGDLVANVWTDRADFSAEHFNASIAVDAGYGPSVAGLGFLDEFAGRHEAALLRYERAFELTPDDYRINLLLGRSLTNGLGGIESNEARVTQVDRARIHLQRAVELQPGLVEGWVALGNTYLWESEDAATGINALEQAFKLQPKRPDVGPRLTRLYVDEGMAVEAHSVVERMVAAGADEYSLQRARTIAQSIELESPTSTTGERASNDALALLTRVRALPDEAQHREEVRHGVEELRESVDKDEFRKRYDEAQRLAATNSFDEAIDQLETLNEIELTDGQRDVVDKRLDEIRAYRSFNQLWEKANGLANAGEIEAAIAVLEPMMSEAPDEASAASVHAQLARLRAYRDFRDQYNRAVKHVEAGDIEAAIAILESLEDATPDETLAARVRALLDDLEGE